MSIPVFIIESNNVDGNNISFVKWGKGQPNGKEWQQCIVVKFDGKDSTYYDDTNCNKQFCSSCQISTENTFKLRGNITQNTDREYFESW